MLGWIVTLAVALAFGGTKPGPAWDPTKTRAFIVCLAGFEGEAPGATSFTTYDRNDRELAAELEARGVPKANITLLLDGDATTAAVPAAFDRVLAASQAGETLFFYYGSHGGYDGDTGEHTYSAFDGSLPVQPFVDAIRTKFRGERVLAFSDACYSGGLVERLKASARADLATWSLSSTGPHNVASSGWRFIDVMLRALRGAPEVDLDHDGTITWGDLASFATTHMMFVASGKPDAATTGRASDDLVLSRGVRSKSDPRIGAYGTVGGERVEVIGVEGDRLRVHPVATLAHDRDTLVAADALTPIAPAAHHPGDPVEVWYASTSKWYPATVLTTFGDLTQAHYDGFSARWDEWFTPDRIRPRP